MQHHLPILVVKITVFLQNGLAAETDGDRLLAIYVAKLSNSCQKSHVNCNDENSTIVCPSLSWYIKHSLIRGSVRNELQLFAYEVTE